MVSFALTAGLTLAAWDINFWPTDAEDYYLDAARQLAEVRYVSQIHSGIDAERVRWAHGKEVFFLLISLVQRLLGDVHTLRPIIIICNVGVFLSAVFIFLLARRLWDEKTAVVCWFLFATSAWPYVYVLMAKHQPIGLAFFLMAVFMLPTEGSQLRKRFFCFYSGMLLGLALFSSTVSSLYLPYYMIVFVQVVKPSFALKSWRVSVWRALSAGIFVLLGLGVPFVYINLPDVLHNIGSYWEYVRISGGYNHFYYNQPFLQQWFPMTPVAHVRGGVVWIFKYFLVIMPVMFPVYFLGIVYLTARSFYRRDSRFLLKALGIIALSISAPLMAETVKVAQYGANYFPALLGVLSLIGYCFADMRQAGLLHLKGFPSKATWLSWGWLVMAVAHLAMNAFIFWGDVYPMRMSKTYLSKEMQRRGLRHVATYLTQPHRDAFIPYLDDDLLERLQFVPIQTLAQVPRGYILVPPITGDSIYIAATSPYIHFDKDLLLNAIVNRGLLERYALISFPTLANSRIWPLEEEILSYRYLILGHRFEHNDLLGRVWVLDAAKIQNELDRIMPLAEDLELMRENWRRIGTQNRFLIFRGHLARFEDPKTLQSIVARVEKIGSPQDSLRAYIYKLGQRQPVWVPVGKRFYSDPLGAIDVKPAGQDGGVVFRFTPPLELDPGMYFMTIYRTGANDDTHYYRIGTQQIFFP